MKIIKICALAIFFMSGLVYSQDLDGRESRENIKIFPRTIQDEMDFVLGEYDTISKKLAVTVDPEEQEALRAYLDFLQKNMSSLSEILDKQDQTERHTNNQEVPETREVPEVKAPEVKKPEQAQALNQPDFVVKQNELLQYLGMVEKSFDWISKKLFDRHLLHDAQNLQLDACMQILTTQMHDVKTALQKLEDLDNIERYKKQIEIALYWVNLVKNAAVRYEIFMVGQDDTPRALIQEPLTRAEYQQALCAIFVKLSTIFDGLVPGADQVSLNDIDTYVRDENIVAKIVREQFPDELQLGQFNSLKRTFALTDQARRAALAYGCTDIDLDQLYPELFTSYLHAVTQFNTNNYGSYASLGTEFMTDLELLLVLFAQRITTLKSQNNKKACLLLELLMTRLLKIKRIITQACAWNFDMTNDQESAELLVAYRSLIQNHEYHVLFVRKPLSDARDLLKTVIERYFENQATSEGFLYDLYALKYRLYELKDEFKAKQEYVPKSWIRWWWSNTSNIHYHPTLTYLDRMLDLVHKTIVLTMPSDARAQQEHDKKESGVIEQILSGQWWSADTKKNIKKDSNGKIVLELFDGLQKRQFDDLKSAAFHALSHVSPLLMVGLMKYLLPYASQELGGKIMNFITDQEKARKDKAIDGKKVIDFITNNPDIYEEFSRKHPDVVESLGRQAAEKMRV